MKEISKITPETLDRVDAMLKTGRCWGKKDCALSAGAKKRMQGLEEPQASAELQPHKHSRTGTAQSVTATCCRGAPLESLTVSGVQGHHLSAANE